MVSSDHKMHLRINKPTRCIFGSASQQPEKACDLSTKHDLVWSQVDGPAFNPLNKNHACMYVCITHTHTPVADLCSRDLPSTRRHDTLSYTSSKLSRVFVQLNILVYLYISGYLCFLRNLLWQLRHLPAASIIVHGGTRCCDSLRPHSPG